MGYLALGPYTTIGLDQDLAKYQISIVDNRPELYLVLDQKSVASHIINKGKVENCSAVRQTE